MRHVFRYHSIQVMRQVFRYHSIQVFRYSPSHIELHRTRALRQASFISPSSPDGGPPWKPPNTTFYNVWGPKSLLKVTREALVAAGPQRNAHFGQNPIFFRSSSRVFLEGLFGASPRLWRVGLAGPFFTSKEAQPTHRIGPTNPPKR